MKIDTSELIRWRYYFLDLPKWAYGARSRGMRDTLSGVFGNEISSIRDGLVSLAGFCGRKPLDNDIEDAVDKALMVKLVRESDGYSALRMTKKNLYRYFQIDGLENLYASIREKRLIVILTGHIGSFFTPPIAFSHLGMEVYPLAAAVTHPVHSTRLFLMLYRFLMRRGCTTPFIYTDMQGKIDRSIMQVFRTNGILFAALDISRGLSPAKRLPVRFLGRASSLPSGLVQWGLKKDAVFLTAWNTVQTTDNIHFIRNLRIDAPFEAGLDAHGILQTYADRLSELLCREPWQWMQVSIINEFDEGSPPD
jgi:lauroyl/myristoyl acyltransferase